MKFRLPSSHPQFWLSYFNWTKIKPRISFSHIWKCMFSCLIFHTKKRIFNILVVCFLVSTQDDWQAKRNNWDSETTPGRQNYMLLLFFFNLSFSYVSLWKDPNIESLLYFLIQVVICRRELDILINDLKRIMSKE